ncbi:TrkA family potassium uptake protein [Paludicola sp. MB14-C6]|uniref:potassium channel family protein n=1 Tax=Paludihabitans sp. MB14-C6 TaxID=3070656 RepID=UPI0027DD5CE8|nr:TrkA family potassium uptake protein [Paludicola sp. MB14-C6]WMJ22988.1 TrkA family potassium uptake protein [Paludicola sp. MB14-C6]
MDAIIIGGGKIGYNLLKTVKERNHNVVLIEKNKDTCIKISEDIDANIICGDGTDPEVLLDSGINNAEIVAAVTGTDEENIVICQIAQVSFHIKKTIARVNNPKNIAMFKALGVDRIVCSTALIADMIQYELDNDEYKMIQTFERGSMILVEVVINQNHPWCNKKIRDLLLNECVIVSIINNEKITYPKGETLICENDAVLFITNHQTLQEMMKKSSNGGTKYAQRKG